MKHAGAETRAGMVAIATDWELPEHSEATCLLGHRARQKRVAVHPARRSAKFACEWLSAKEKLSVPEVAEG